MDKPPSTFVFKNPVTGETVSDSPKSIKSWLKNNIGRTLFFVLLVLVIVELSYGAYSFFAPEKFKAMSIIPKKVNESTGATLSLVSNKVSYKTGEPVLVDVKLFTGGFTTDSTDLVIKYDPQILAPSADNFAVSGNIYSEYPGVQIDKQKGLIGISGITLPGQKGFSGVGKFAKLNFNALKNGNTKVVIEFEAGETSDSNVVLSGSSKDILAGVENADINIGSVNSVNASENGKNKCEGFTQICQDALGKAGSQECIGGVITFGACNYDMVYTLSCGECKTQ